MEPSPAPVVEPGNSLSIVSSVYVAILLPWAFLYLHDFISDRWQTIRRTSIAGLVHLAVAIGPLPYILYYAYLQFSLSDPDYKELFAVVTAAAFSAYHVLRTLFGLYQLSRFRQWAVDVATTLESAGFECALTQGADRPQVLYAPPLPLWRRVAKWMHKWRHGDKPTGAGNVRRQRRRLGGGVNALSLNAALQGAVKHAPGGRVSLEVGRGGGVQGRFPGCVSSTHSMCEREKETVRRERRIRWLVDRMVVNSSVIDNELFQSYAPFRFLLWKWRLQPRHRKNTFVKWLVVYLAQFGRDWVRTCKTTGFDGRKWSGRRWNFAARVWATAALRMETEFEDAEMKGNVGATSFLDPCEWGNVTDSMDEQLFSKTHLLRECFAEGRGLPYGCKIIDDRSKPLPSHSLYKPLIKDAIESLPTRYYGDVEHLTPDHIEWFAVFACVGSWGGCVPRPKANDPSQAVETARERSHREEILSAAQVLAPTDAPVRVLQDQLGFESPPTLSKCVFPFYNRTYGRTLWDNRSILHVSARIDNWIGLSIGSQVAHLLMQETGCGPGGCEFEKAHKLEESAGEGGDGGSTRQESRSNNIVHFHKELEIRRLRYQLSDPNPQHKHLEHGLSFMGCITESTRSGIAENLYETGNVSDWRPKVPEETVSFLMSNQLKCCLRKVFAGPGLARFDSSLQERLLWECQNGVYRSWQNKVALGRFQKRFYSAPQGVEVMMLCLLGFPSIQMLNLNLNKNQERNWGSSADSCLEFQLWPIAGPQPFHLKIYVDWPESMMIAKIGVSSPVMFQGPSGSRPEFRWQDWRDAFEGRCIGKAEWQRTHYMSEFEVRRTKSSIARGIEAMVIGSCPDNGSSTNQDARKCLIWEGWRPIRQGLTLFELRHSSLIVIGDSMPMDAFQSGSLSLGAKTLEAPFVSRQASRIFRESPYNRANLAALTDASVHLDSLLTLNATLVHEGHEKTKAPCSGYDLDGFADLETEGSSSSSADPIMTEVFRSTSPPDPEQIISRAKEQDPIAMHVLAKWMLNGTYPARRNRDKALLLMERALVLGRNIETARQLVNTLLGNRSAPSTSADVDRALRNLDLLWRDMFGCQAVHTSNTGHVRSSKSDAKAELVRMARLRELHLHVVRVHPTAATARALADRLSTLGVTREDEDHAVRLYETAVLARCDGQAMSQLGRAFSRKNARFAAAMLRRAVACGARDAPRLLADIVQREDGVGGREVLEQAARLGDVEAMRRTGLMLLHGQGGERDLKRGQSLLERVVYGEVVARQFGRGVPWPALAQTEAQWLRGRAMQALEGEERVDVGSVGDGGGGAGSAGFGSGSDS